MDAEKDAPGLAWTRVATAQTEQAPDGSEVRPLLRAAGASMAHFELLAGQTSRAVQHRSVEEIWFCLSGRGQLWRELATKDSVEGSGVGSVVELAAGVCLTIPPRCCFQFRSLGDESLCIVGVTVPPWPGADQAILVDGPWIASRG